MILKHGFGETIRHAVKVNTLMTCDKLGYDLDTWKKDKSEKIVTHPKHNHDVQIEVSKIMANLVRGRIYPERRHSTSVNEEVLSLTRTHDFKGCYPKECKRDDQKFAYLQKLYKNGEIDVNMLIEFSTVLNFDKQKLMETI